MADERFDGLFTTVTDGAKGIENLLDAFFGFLGRKTDFYHLANATPDPARDLVVRAYEKHKGPALARLDAERRYAQEAEQRRKVKQEEAEEREWRRKQEELRQAPRVEEVFDEDEPPVTATSAPAPPEKEDEGGPAPIGNGGTTDRYTWTQTLSTVDISIPLKAPVASSRQCKVDITATSLRVTVAGTVLIEGKLLDKVKPADCLWTLEDLRAIHITLEKVEGMRWWSCVLEGDATIDTKKIVPENSKLSDLDPELRQTVEKMMFDQEQKARGLPTSDQRHQADILDAFKKQHPEMDFSQAKINWGSQGQFGGF